MLRQSTPFTWEFTCEKRKGLSVRHSRFTGTFDLCRRTQVGEMCWETQTLSSHPTLEQAVSASEEHALVGCP
jgi:hypothetical protein